MDEMRMTANANEEFWRLYRSIGRIDSAAGMAWALAVVSGITVAVTDFVGLIRLLLGEYIKLQIVLL